MIIFLEALSLTVHLFESSRNIFSLDAISWTIGHSQIFFDFLKRCQSHHEKLWQPTFISLLILQVLLRSSTLIHCPINIAQRIYCSLRVFLHLKPSDQSKRLQTLYFEKTYKDYQPNMYDALPTNVRNQLLLPGKCRRTEIKCP